MKLFVSLKLKPSIGKIGMYKENEMKRRDCLMSMQSQIVIGIVLVLGGRLEMGGLRGKLE